MLKLGINIDHIATLRQARGGSEPDLLDGARIAEEAGADGITVHLREDRRHIQDNDVFQLRKKVRTKLNLEMAVSEEIIRVILKLKPHNVCMVPEKRQELTTEGGLDVCSRKRKINKAINRLRKKKIIVSLFIDPELRQVRAAREVGADCVELHTGAYANAKTQQLKGKELERLKKAGGLAVNLGLILNAGRGLDYKNVVPVARISGMNELNIGHSIISRAITVGLKNAVREMKKLLKSH